MKNKNINLNDFNLDGDSSRSNEVDYMLKNKSSNSNVKDVLENANKNPIISIAPQYVGEMLNNLGSKQITKVVLQTKITKELDQQLKSFIYSKKCSLTDAVEALLRLALNMPQK